MTDQVKPLDDDLFFTRNDPEYGGYLVIDAATDLSMGYPFPTRETAMPDFDSRPDTHEHIAQVRGLLLGVSGDLTRRAHVHDRSKLVEPEVSGFDEYTPKLRETTYGSCEYKAFLAELGKVLAHHYAANDHHPEHFDNGVADMSLIQLIEMLCDWIAATRRHKDGNIRRSIDLNVERFGYGPEIQMLLHNTVDAILATEVLTDEGEGQ